MRAPGSDTPAVQPSRILLVDDDPSVRSSVRKHLTERGLQVIAIGTGDQPMRVLSGETDLLLAEVALEKAEGLALLRYARASHPELAILALTSPGDLQAAMTATRAGADDVVVKPLDLSKLTSAVERRLEASRRKRHEGRSPAPRAEAARSYQLPPSLGLRDPDTDAYGLSFFVEYVTKELQRSMRYGRPFGLATLRVGGARELLREHGAAPIRGLLRAILAAVARTARDVDVVARLEEDEFGVILPETDHFGALMFQRRAIAAVAEDAKVKELSANLPFSLEVGAATHSRDGKTLDELLSRCRERAVQGRRSIVRGLEALGFWESIGELLEGSLPTLPSAASDEELGPSSRRLGLSAATFQSIRAEAMREVAREPEGRGLLYVSAGSDLLQASLPLLEALTSGGSTWSVHLLGRRGPSSLHHPAMTPVYVDAQDPACHHDLLLFLSERTAYGLVRKAGEHGPAFHSNDGPLISHLVTRLQQAYELHTY